MSEREKLVLPVTEAGRDLDRVAVTMWVQPEDPKAPYDDPRGHSQSATATIRAGITDIEQQARALALREVREEVAREIPEVAAEELADGTFLWERAGWNAARAAVLATLDKLARDSG